MFLVFVFHGFDNNDLAVEWVNLAWFDRPLSQLLGQSLPRADPLGGAAHPRTWTESLTLFGTDPKQVPVASPIRPPVGARRSRTRLTRTRTFSLRNTQYSCWKTAVGKPLLENRCWRTAVKKRLLENRCGRTLRVVCLPFDLATRSTVCLCLVRVWLVVKTTVRPTRAQRPTKPSRRQRRTQPQPHSQSVSFCGWSARHC